MRALAALERSLDRLCAAGAWLALPVSLLLLAQWPLRTVEGGQPQLANDVAQILFALYVALALRHTTRHGVHLSAHRGAGRAAPRLARAAQWLVLLPWSLGCLWLALPMLASSVQQLERFPDSLNPGYFLLKLCLLPLLLLTALQALLDLRPRPGA
jgi:hypothetical protein